MSEANSKLLLLFVKVTTRLTRKLPQGIERKRDSIEFERSENQFSFFLFFFFSFFNPSESISTKGFQHFKSEKITVKSEKITVKSEKITVKSEKITVKSEKITVKSEYFYLLAFMQ